MRKFKIQNSKFLILNCIFAFCILNFTFSLAQDASKEEESLFVAKKAFEDGFYDVSLGLLERFLKNYPSSLKSTEANLLIGECYFHQSKFLDALNKFEDLLQQPQAKGMRDAVLYWIAEVHFKGNNYAKAARYYKMVCDEFPRSDYAAPSFYSLGWCLFQEEEYGKAQEYFEIVEEKFPKEPQAQDSSFKIIECLYQRKLYQALKEKIKSYLKSYPKDSPRLAYLYFYLAEAEYYLDNFNPAIDAYKKVIQNTADERIIALSNLGVAWSYFKLKRYKEAEDNFLEIKPAALEKRSQDVLLLGKAALMVETNRLDQARHIYNEILKTSSDNLVLVQAYLGRADALYNLADYPEAVKAYKEGLSAAAGDTPQELLDKLHYGLSWAYLKQGEFKDAISEFQKVAKESPDKIVKVSALCQIGDAYQDAGDFKKAQEAYDTILKDYPDSFYSDYVQYQLGLVLLKSSNYDGAIMGFLSLKRNSPNSKLLDDATYALGLAYFQRQDYKSSKEVFEKFQDEFKGSRLKPEALYLLGSSLYNLEDFARAQEVFRSIVRDYNQDTELVQKAEYEIADCLNQMGNEKEAMARFKILRTKYPNSSLTPEIIWWLGEYYYRHNDLSLARRYFSSLAQDFPQSNLVPDAYYAVASSFAQEENFSEAVENFKKVVAHGDSDLAGQAAIAIADIYVKQDQPQEALASYRNTIEAYPHLANLIYPKLADLLFKLGDYQQALEFYRRSLEEVPVTEMAKIQFKIAETLQAEGQADEAIQEYMKVTYLYSENNALSVKALLRVGAIYEDKEKFNEALNIYRRVAESGAAEAKYARERIECLKKTK